MNTKVKVVINDLKSLTQTLMDFQSFLIDNQNMNDKMYNYIYNIMYAFNDVYEKINYKEKQDIANMLEGVEQNEMSEIEEYLQDEGEREKFDNLKKKIIIAKTMYS